MHLGGANWKTTLRHMWESSIRHLIKVKYLFLIEFSFVKHPNSSASLYTYQNPLLGIILSVLLKQSNQKQSLTTGLYTIIELVSPWTVRPFLSSPEQVMWHIPSHHSCLGRNVQSPGGTWQTHCTKLFGESLLNDFSEFYQCPCCST